MWRNTRLPSLVLSFILLCSIVSGQAKLLELIEPQRGILDFIVDPKGVFHFVYRPSQDSIQLIERSINLPNCDIQFDRPNSSKIVQFNTQGVGITYKPYITMPGGQFLRVINDNLWAVNVFTTDTLSACDTFYINNSNGIGRGNILSLLLSSSGEELFTSHYYSPHLANISVFGISGSEDFFYLAGSYDFDSLKIEHLKLPPDRFGLNEGFIVALNSDFEPLRFIRLSGILDESINSIRALKDSCILITYNSNSPNFILGSDTVNSPLDITFNSSVFGYAILDSSLNIKTSKTASHNSGSSFAQAVVEIKGENYYLVGGYDDDSIKIDGFKFVNTTESTNYFALKLDSEGKVINGIALWASDKLRIHDQLALNNHLVLAGSWLGDSLSIGNTVLINDTENTEQGFILVLNNELDVVNTLFISSKGQSLPSMLRSWNDNLFVLLTDVQSAVYIDTISIESIEDKYSGYNAIIQLEYNELVSTSKAEELSAGNNCLRPNPAKTFNYLKVDDQVEYDYILLHDVYGSIVGKYTATNRIFAPNVISGVYIATFVYRSKIVCQSKIVVTE